MKSLRSHSTDEKENSAYLSALNAMNTGRHYYPQAWLLLVSILLFGTYVAWDKQAFGIVTSMDRSYMASLIIALILLGSCHCGWHVIHNSIRIEQAQLWLHQAVTGSHETGPYLKSYLDDLGTNRMGIKSTADSTIDDSIVEIHADKIRGAVELGWFFVDLAVRLGLLGTIIGFILIFTSLSDLTITGGDDLKKLLIAMSGGMGTALLTTLTGLIGASVLGFQYLILGRASEHLIGLLLRVRNRYQQPALEEL